MTWLLLLIGQIRLEKGSICVRTMVDFLWRLPRKQIWCEVLRDGFSEIQLLCYWLVSSAFVAHVLLSCFLHWFVSSFRLESCHLMFGLSSSTKERSFEWGRCNKCPGHGLFIYSGRSMKLHKEKETYQEKNMQSHSLYFFSILGSYKVT